MRRRRRELGAWRASDGRADAGRWVYGGPRPRPRPRRGVPALNVGRPAVPRVWRRGSAGEGRGSVNSMAVRAQAIREGRRGGEAGHVARVFRRSGAWTGVLVAAAAVRMGHIQDDAVGGSQSLVRESG